MKNYLDCYIKIEGHLELYRNCDLSTTDNKLLDIKELKSNIKDIHYLRYHIPVFYFGNIC